MNTVDIFSRAVAINGAKFSRDGLEISSANAQTLAEIGGVLRVLRSGLSWWEGDHAVAMMAAGRRKRKDDSGSMGGQMDIEVVKEYAEVHGGRKDSLLDAAWVADFFSKDERVVGVSFEHHFEAWVGVCDLAKKGGACGAIEQWRAIEWLGQARKQGMRLSEFRCYVRTAVASLLSHSQHEKKPDSEDRLRRASDFGFWAAREVSRVDMLTPDEAAELADSLRPVVELVDVLRSRAGAAGAGKESISPSASRR
jgi:hypothetical protein